MATNSERDRQNPAFLGSDRREDGDSLAVAAVTQFLGKEHAPVLNRISQGLSGATVYRCRSAIGSFALKCWPAGTTSQRVDEVHRIQRFASDHLSSKGRCGFDPTGNTCPSLVPRLTDLGGHQFRLTLADRHFDLSTWMPGTAYGFPKLLAVIENDDKNLLSMLSAIQAGASAIAKFHQATLALGTEVSPAPAVIRRLKRLAELRIELPAVIAYSHRLTGPAKVAAEQLTRNGDRMHRDSETLLRKWEHTPVKLQWVLRDVHREHVLFENGEVSGIVDFDAVRSDTVATDLARWVGSFAESWVPLEQLWDAAIAGYASVGEISPCEQNLSGAIEQASWYIHLANWVTWIAGEPQNVPGGIVAAQSRVASLLRRSDV